MKKTSLERFYRDQLPDGIVKDSVLTAECPFCKKSDADKKGKVLVFLNPTSFFYGYFRCLSHCMERGYAHWFAHLAGADPTCLPYIEENELVLPNSSFPGKNINTEIDGFQSKLTGEELALFKEAHIGRPALRQLSVGYNGRYLVYPYVQMDGNVYSARCVHPDKQDDFFWYGDKGFAAGPTGLFNVGEIARCAGGALFICEGEENLLTLKQLGFPGVAYCDPRVLEEIDPELLVSVKTIFIIPGNNLDSYSAAKNAATRIGFKVRILAWKSDSPREYNLRQFATDQGSEFAKGLGRMISSSRPFSPFITPEQEHSAFFSSLNDMSGDEYGSLLSGFSLLDDRLGGIHGINIFGGGPKVGKSCFMIQIATMMAQKKIPVLYYDFENGRQRIYQRTLTRLSRIETSRLLSDQLSDDERLRQQKHQDDFKQLLHYFRVVNDRKLSPEIMRRHIDFLRHETQSEYTVVVIDSLHKLPFKDLAEMRSGIDAWLRQLESIRDELNVSFLVISELSRGDKGSYEGQPHMGAFKGSGDIEYSADNAMILLPDWDHMHAEMAERVNTLWLVGSRENRPGMVGKYILEYPFWGFREVESS